MTKEKHGHGVGGAEVATGLVECVEVLHGVWPCAVFEYRHSSGFMRANKCLCATEFVSNKETILPLLTATNQAACKPATNGFTGRLGLAYMHYMRLSISLWYCLLAAALSNQESEAWMLAFKPNWPLA